MKTSKYWLSALAAALGCALGMPSFGDETNDESYQSQPVFRPALVQQQVPTSRWDAQEPVETPEQDAIAPSAPGTCVCSEPCDFGLQLVAGAEATFLWPQLSRTYLETAFVNGLGPVDIINDSALGSADGALLVGPRLTLGVQGDCWGLVGRYWNSATWASGFTPAAPDSAQSGVILFDTFRAYTLDLEVQRRFCWRNWDAFGFFGVRHASVNNDRNLWIQNSFGSDLIEASAYAGQQYNGTGITFGFFGLRPLFCDGGALKAYFTHRYSILWGNGLAAVQTRAMAANTIAFAQSTDGALAIGDGDLFLVELGFGLQWESCLKCLPGRVFLRTGVEWQYWDTNTGVLAGSLSFADVITASSAAFTETGELLFDLVGFTFGAGITY
ncbi:MAG: hypothetical protein WD063_09380 [Pirellulales bacterium]